VIVYVMVMCLWSRFTDPFDYELCPSGSYCRGLGGQKLCVRPIVAVNSVWKFAGRRHDCEGTELPGEVRLTFFLVRVGHHGVPT